MKQFDSFRLDTSNECLWQSGAQIALPPKPFAILRYLVENPGRLITHDELLDALWPETYVQPQVLRTYMLELRKVLGDDAGAPRFIQTLPKRGYCFVAAVVEGAEARSAASLRRLDPERDIRSRLAGHLSTATKRCAACAPCWNWRPPGSGRSSSSPEERASARPRWWMHFCARPASAPAIDRARPVRGGHGQERRVLPGDGGPEPTLRLARWRTSLPHPGADGAAVASRAGADAAETAPRIRCLMRGRSACPANCARRWKNLPIEKPLLLVFEDLHWADESTLGLISALARRRTPARLMVLATCRAQDGSADQPLKRLKQDLVMRRLGVELELQPLDRQAVGQLLMRELKQDDLPAGPRRVHVYNRSEGNPLFVIAMLEHLITQRYLVREGTDQAGRRKQRTPFLDMDPDLPDELSQMIELEIERLSPDDQRLLEAGSLINVAFPAWAVAAALEEDTPETEEACDELAHRLYFVRRAGQDELPDGTRSAFYVFAHGLYREVLYQRQSASRRARRHTRIAERLGELFAGREANVAQEMAMHYEAAGNWSRAASVLRSAAWQARQRRAHGEAAALLEHALRAAENLSDVEAGVAREIRSDLVAVRESMQASSALHGATEKV